MKNRKQPHAQCEYAYFNSPRCGARRKYDGQPCQAPATRGNQRCRMHGGARGSGAPRENKNAIKHGIYTLANIHDIKSYKKIYKGLIKIN